MFHAGNLCSKHWWFLQNWSGDLPGGDWLPDVEVREICVHEGSDYPLALVAVPRTKLELILYFDPQRFERDDVARMLGHLKVLLEAFTRDPQCSIGQLPLSTENEREQVLHQWVGSATEYPRESTVVELFEEQVALRAEAVAVQFEGQELSYGELNARSNRLARWLRGRGRAGRDGWCAVERRCELVVAWICGI